MKVSGFSVNDVLWQGLRSCQQGSIETALRYVRKPLSTNEKSCLISLPTGAGKSGVISVISHKATQKRVLVLCHRRAVCDQLFKDINGVFFSERAEGENIPLKAVFNQIDDTSKNGIYVSTFQKLQTFNTAQLEKLKQDIDLVIIDEGHAEPSPIWSTLVRGLGAHKIIITATPYRNDLFQFDITSDSSYIYTFENALADNVLCDPPFELAEQHSLSASIRQFLDENPGTKCIIKCDKFSDLLRYYTLLNDDFNLLAIHEQFKNDKRNNVKVSVPANLKNSPYDVIIHQRKLDEGVDIPQAKLLVLTYAVSSGRELVQTIGRVVRLFENIQPKILDLTSGANENMWLNYRRFDSSLSSQGAVKTFIDSLDINRLIERYLDGFPDSSYYGNRFLNKFDLNDFDPEKSLNIPTASICFLEKMIDFNVQVLSDTLYWRSNNNGELAKQFNTQCDIHVVVSIAFNKSKFLSDQFFFEPSLEITLFKELSHGVIAIYDSRGRRFSGDDELKLGYAVSQDKLFNVMALGESSTAKEASSKSINSARRRPESFAVKSPNLDQIADLQVNASYRLSTMKCDVYDQNQDKSGSYYVGVDSGRISDQKESSFSLDELNDWLEKIEAIITSNSVINSALVHSFAKPIAADVNLEVESLIFDFTEFDCPLGVLVNDERYEIDNSFLYRGYHDGFLLVPDIISSKITIHLQEKSPYLILRSESNLQFEAVENELDVLTMLTEHLHKVLLQNGITYSQGEFYQLQLPTEEGFQLSNSNIANTIIGLDSLCAQGIDEKGYLGNGAYHVINDEFSEHSVFYLLDQLKSNALDNPARNDLGPFYPYIPDADLLLNTDMGTEPADFIISSKNKLVYVHVKCGGTNNPQSSAGALAEVGSQSIKNMEMLISSSDALRPGNWNRLSSAWPSPNATSPMQERIRMLNRQRFTASDDNCRGEALSELWDLIAQRRRSTSVKKEIWIVAANSFSASHLERQLSLGSGALSETLQAYQLINSWVATSNNNDVELKIFVSP